MSEIAPVVFGLGISQISSSIADTTITLMDRNGNRMTSLSQVSGWDPEQFLEDLHLEDGQSADLATLVLTGQQWPGDPNTSLAIYVEHTTAGTLGAFLQRYTPTRPALYGPNGEQLDPFAFVPAV